MITAAKVVDFKQISKLQCKPAAKIQLRYAIYLRSGNFWHQQIPTASCMILLALASTIELQRRES